MRSIQDCEELFTQIIRQRLPDFKEKIYFRPLHNIDKGDIGSDCCVAIGKYFKTAPYHIFQKLSAELSADMQPKVDFNDGVLSLKLDFGDGPYRRQECTVTDNSLTQDYCIALPPIKLGFNSMPYARVYSLAFWQAKLLADYGKEVSFCNGFSQAQNAEHFAAIKEIRKSLKQCEDQPQPQANPLYWNSGISRNRRLFLWIPNNYLNKNDFQSLLLKANDTFQSFKVQSIASEWLHPFDGEPSCNQVASYSDEALRSLLFLLPSSSPAFNIDLSASCLKEKTNLLWMAESCRERLQRYFTVAHTGGKQFKRSIWHEIDASIRHRILHSLVFMDCLRAEAAFNGEVAAWVAALHEFADAVYRLLNNPVFRLTMEKGEFMVGENEILAGIEALLSSIVALVRGLV